MTDADDEPMTTTTVRMAASLEQAIEGQLDWGESKGRWIAEACRQRLSDELELDEV